MLIENNGLEEMRFRVLPGFGMATTYFRMCSKVGAWLYCQDVRRTKGKIMDTKAPSTDLVYYGFFRFAHSRVEIWGLSGPPGSDERVTSIDICPTSGSGQEPKWTVEMLAFAPIPGDTQVIKGYVGAAFAVMARGYNLRIVQMRSVPNKEELYSAHPRRHHVNDGGYNKGYIPNLKDVTEFLVSGLPVQEIIKGDRYCPICGADFYSRIYPRRCLPKI